MPETPAAEFWKDLQPIAKEFQRDTLPEVYIHNAPTDDEKLYVPFTETVSSRPLRISRLGRGRRVVRGRRDVPRRRVDA
jgi:2,4'-dihydroxyacetophenone dioxygenase